MLNGANLASGGKNANSKIHNVVNCLMFADLYRLSERERVKVEPVRFI